MAGGGIAGRLYRGEVSINFVRRQRTWYTISGIILLVSVISLLTRGLNFSMEFTGGSSFTFPVTSASSGPVTTVQGQISRLVAGAGGGTAQVQQVTSLSQHNWVVQTASLGKAATVAVSNALSNAFHLSANSISVQFTGATWGSQITSKAVEALIIFLVVIVIYLSVAFEWRMAVAAFAALLHDILITVGVYSLTGFSVSPTSVIGLLTILGYSLYDTVVVFDKVRENTAGILTTQRSTYSEAANLALNQTLVRSINTSLTALIPVASILFVGAGLLGAGTLKDLALVLFVGMLSGTYSSIFIATPVLADLKERDPKYKDLAVKVNRRLAGGRRAAAEAASATAASATAASATAPSVTAAGAAGTVASAATPAAAAAADTAHTDDAAEMDSGESAGQDEGEDVTVPAAAARPAPRQVTRQQRVTGGTQRRPGSAKKKRR